MKSLSTGCNATITQLKVGLEDFVCTLLSKAILLFNFFKVTQNACFNFISIPVLVETDCNSFSVVPTELKETKVGCKGRHSSNSTLVISLRSHDKAQVGSSIIQFVFRFSLRQVVSFISELKVFCSWVPGTCSFVQGTWTLCLVKFFRAELGHLWSEVNFFLRQVACSFSSTDAIFVFVETS